MDWQAAGLWQPYWIKCKHQVSAVVYSQPDLGAIYTNFWHTVAMYVNPIFWALPENKQLLLALDMPPTFHLISLLMPSINYEAIFLPGEYPDLDFICCHNVTKGTMANLFWHTWFFDSPEVKQEDAAVCKNSLYVRTKGTGNLRPLLKNFAAIMAEACTTGSGPGANTC